VFDDPTVAGAIFEVLDGSNRWKSGVSERGEALYALAEQILESRLGRKVRAEPEQFERRSAAVVEHEQPVAETVRASGGVPAGQAKTMLLNTGTGGGHAEVH